MQTPRVNHSLALDLATAESMTQIRDKFKSTYQAIMRNAIAIYIRKHVDSDGGFLVDELIEG